VKRSIFFFIMLVVSVITGAFTRPSQAFGIDQGPRVFVLEPASLIEAKTRLGNRDPQLLPPYNKLLRDAERALRTAPASVMDKKTTPPSGDKHDYMSLAPYWWPNPNTRDGLPYVRHDGKLNPERDKISDKKNLENLIFAVRSLTLAYFFTGEEKYAAHAAKLLRVWFIDDVTRMNPNLRHAQAIPGRNQGRDAGIIETHKLPELVDAAGLLRAARSWRQADQKALQFWFSSYLDWLLESPEGRAEANAPNNHGSWYDVQVASYALFVEWKDIAGKVLGEVSAKRITRQIEPDGRQPRELKRTQAWSYSLFNLEALFEAASLGDKLELDLWKFETADGRSIRKALNWLVPFATGDKKWTYREISGWRPERIFPLLRRAAIRYRDPSYEAAISKLPGWAADARDHLLYPKPVSHSKAALQQSKNLDSRFQ
jgi:hypothetical protein